jgi:Malectin domain
MKATRIGRFAALLFVLGILLHACTTGLVYRIDAGGPAVFPFQADGYVSGGQVASTAAAIDTSAVVNPAPMAVYQTVRWNQSTYTLPSLNPGASHLVRLHFAEITYNAAGLRKFHVKLNGTQVLTDFDIFAAAGAKNKAVVREFTVAANTSGAIVIEFLNGAVDFPAIAAIEILAPMQINAAGPAVPPFRADAFFTGGFTSSTASAIDTSGVTDPAPAAVYQTVRWAQPTYTLTGLAAGSSYRLRLHFSEIAFNAPGVRRFDVTVNGVLVLDEFDIFAAAGGANKAVVRDFRAKANGSGQVVVNFIKGSVDWPAIAGIEVLPDPSYQVDSAGPNTVPYSADDYVSGGTPVSTGATIDLSGVTADDPPPMAVYQTSREGVSTYTFTELRRDMNYKVRLHFAEIAYSAAGQRRFDVRINGERYLRNFDVFAAAKIFFDPGQPNRAVLREYPAKPDANGQIVVQFQNGTAAIPAINGIEVVPEARYLVNAGGAALPPYDADAHFAGGNITSTAATIDTSGAPNPAWAGVYQTARDGAATYTIGDLFTRFQYPGFGSSAQYKVRLHFAETVYNGSGARRFNVALNGTPVLTDFDVFAAAGAKNKAVVRDFMLTPNAAKQIVVQTSNGSAATPTLSGLEVLRFGGELWPAADALFKRDQRWRGSDGAISINLGSNRILWVFGDTFVDLVPPYARAGSTFIRNSVALQVGTNPETASFTGKWKLNGSAPSDYFPSPASGHWYWGGQGITVGSRLVMFVSEEALGSGNPPPIITVAARAITVDNYGDDPDAWNLVFTDIADPSFSFGRIGPSGIWRESGYVYLWGVGPATGAFCPSANVYLWRYTDAAILAADFSNPEYWTGSAYTPLSAMTGDPTAVTDGATGFTMHKTAAGKWVLYQGDVCFGPGEFRTASAKEGPFSAKVMEFSPPEAGGYLTYLWKAHPWLTGPLPGQVALTYSSNGDNVFSDETIYYPRFVKVIEP